MDFSNRTTQPQPVAPAAHPAPAPVSGGKKSKRMDNAKLARILTVAGVVVVAVLLAAVLLLVSNGNSSSDENKYVDSNKLQAVFLNTGQVYFGNIKTLNSHYYVVTNIYYLQTSSTGATTSASNANTSVSLVKLGCELHEPYDQMVINSSQVTFWENLQANGQVAKAVASFEKANPNGQKCSDQSASSSTTSGNSVQNAGTSNSGAPSTTTTPTTTKP